MTKQVYIIKKCSLLNINCLMTSCSKLDPVMQKMWLITIIHGDDEFMNGQI